MPIVLIPTDFSDNSLNAAVYAVKLFGEEGNQFIVLHAYHMPHGTASTMWSINEMLAEEAQNDLEDFQIRLKDGLPGSNAEIELDKEHGDLPNVVGRFRKDPEPPALVVMGTQGASGLKETFFGSTTASVIKQGGLPVLAVPQDAVYKTPKRILLADDGGPIDKATLKPLLDIARWSHSEVMIVRVVNEKTGTEDAGKSSVYDELLGAIPHSYHYLSGENIEVALNNMADQSDADVIAVIHRHRGVFDQMFRRSTATQLVMHTHTPMLVLQHKAG